MPFNTRDTSRDPTVLHFVGRNLVGVAGAFHILNHVTPDKRSLHVGSNLLGNDGTAALIHGLEAKRALLSGQAADHVGSGHTGHSSYGHKGDAHACPWGLVQINVAHNDVGDEGLVAAVKYARSDPKMTMMFAHSNKITLGENVLQVVDDLAASNISSLALGHNSLTPEAALSLFKELDAPHLHELDLSSCRIRPQAAEAIADFIASPRSGELRRLYLDSNYLGRDGVLLIVNAVEKHNFTLEKLGLCDNHRTEQDLDELIRLEEEAAREAEEAAAREEEEEETPPEGHLDAEDQDEDPEDANQDEVAADDGNAARNRPQRRQEDVQSSTSASFLDQETHDPLIRHLDTLLYRNINRGERVREAAARAIAPTRVILQAKRAPPPPDSSPDKHFRLLDLPLEIQLMIARHTSRDATALSDAQWTRLVRHASDRSSITRMGDTVNDCIRCGYNPKTRRSCMGCALDIWCSEIGCRVWELN